MKQERDDVFQQFPKSWKRRLARNTLFTVPLDTTGTPTAMTGVLWSVPIFTLFTYLLSRLHYSLPAPRPP
jgi:hypothetical protein